jgi:hypothetical protein
MRYLRFVAPSVDRQSGRRSGIIHAAFYLKEEGQLADYEEEELEKVFGWLNKNLPVPTRLSKKRNSHQGRPQGISWFKGSATECVSMIRIIAAILEEHGIPVQQLVSDRPGKIVYEDEYQIVALPFAETPT